MPQPTDPAPAAAAAGLVDLEAISEAYEAWVGGWYWERGDAEDEIKTALPGLLAAAKRERRLEAEVEQLREYYEKVTGETWAAGPAGSGEGEGRDGQ